MTRYSLHVVRTKQHIGDSRQDDQLEYAICGASLTGPAVEFDGELNPD